MPNDLTLIHFRDPLSTSAEGIVALGGNLSATNLLRAYRRGIFPWPIDEHFLPWCCPEQRAILEFKDLHVPRRLARLQRQMPFHLTIDQAFEAVIVSCAEIERKEATGTWITPQMIRAYCELHRLGHAHSVEVWEGDTLVGGLYGVDAGGAFSGESMFCSRSNASKLALLHLIEHLQKRGVEWIDIQMMSPHMEALGAKSIHRSEFLKKLSLAQHRKLLLFAN
ncbi:MAG: leucyl/phenylalanyl-tRNA--protein transferase [Pyrinomonadaceae bacterium]|nr:leucyl/phenylalanyl-tRNA--protein transferase [Pyrinomonadaceae bacterium]